MKLGDFSNQADAYVRARPGYPSTLLDTLIEEASLRSWDAVVDIGAGTGLFTKLLVERGFTVTAIEPSDAMRERAEVPDARWLNGTFEDNSLVDASQAWAVAAQAFHWADPPRALPRVRKALRPGGVFTVLWNDRANDESDLLQWTANAIRKHVPKFDEAYRNVAWETVLESTGDFRCVSQRSESHTVSMSRDRFLDLWRSHNRLNHAAGPERLAELIAEIQRHVDQLQVDQFEIPYRCNAWSAVRVD